MSAIATAIVASTVVSSIANNNAADAQSGIAKSQLEQQQNDRASALKYAAPTTQEMDALQKSISLNEGDIQRKEKLIASSDPALMESGKQALQLLRGEDAKTLAPLRENLAKQESQLREKLQSQLGPGYENTTAGIQALEEFKRQSNSSLVSAQQSSLAQLLGVAQDTSSRYGAQSNIANEGTLAQLFGNIQNRQVNAISGTPITGAGAQYVGDLQSARGIQQTLGTVLNAGATYFGASGGFGGGSTSSVASPTAASFYTLNGGTFNNPFIPAG